MNKISGNIYDTLKNCFFKGTIFYEDKIFKIEEDLSVKEDQYIIPGLIDSHIHIESSMLTPLEYSKIALKHGVIGAITDPHEIANVCGIEGIDFMIRSANLTPMKIFIGAPSCVPATPFETSGAIIKSNDIKYLFEKLKCSHLSEMMNFPGVINNNQEVLEKLDIAKSLKKNIDGHAPLLTGEKLDKYISAGISTEHESISLEEAKEKISKGMKIFIRESTAAQGFNKMHELISSDADSIMFCTDDCHPYDLENHYIDDLFRRSLKQGHSISNIIKVSSKNAVTHYNLDFGLLRINDYADFIVVNNFKDFSIKKVVVNGIEVFDGIELKFNTTDDTIINKFYSNSISETDLKVPKIGNSINVIQAFDNSLITRQFKFKVDFMNNFIEPSIDKDILKIVVLNRYSKAKPSIGFIKGFKIKEGAIGSSIAHDSHNLIAIGTSDTYICRVLEILQKAKGGIAYVNNKFSDVLTLQIGGLMSLESAKFVSEKYSKLNYQISKMGCKMKNPFITLSFMALLVIPELKIGDKGLFDVTKFEFIDLQY
ncbi:MAG: adenine deaminase [Prolixibacteraceae bacterium]|nr:adenine deaminase [Prolixibacteraceae bacterium]